MHHNDENTPLCVSQHTFSLFPFSLYLSLRLTFCMFLCPSIFFPSLSICSSLPECLSSLSSLLSPSLSHSLTHILYTPFPPLSFLLSDCFALPCFILSLFLSLSHALSLWLSLFIHLSHSLTHSVSVSLSLCHFLSMSLSSFCLSSLSVSLSIFLSLITYPAAAARFYGFNTITCKSSKFTFE